MAMLTNHITNRRTAKYINRLLLSFSNVSRGIFISLFGLIVNYLLLYYKASNILNTYVYCISIVNLFLVFANWSGKDYNTKILTANPGKIPETISSLANSRLVMFLIMAVLVLFVPLDFRFKLFIVIYALLKTFNSIFDSLIAIQKEFHAFLVIDFLLNVSFLLLVLFDQNTLSAELFLLELTILEVLKLTVSMFFFRKFIAYSFNLKEGIKTLIESRSFFYISLAGFICSKADLYVVGSFFDKPVLSRYFIILNLASLSQVCYATFVSTFSSNIFRYNQKAFKNFSAYSFKTGFVFSVLACAGIYLVSNYYYKIGLDLTFTIFMFFNILFFTQVLTQMYHYTRASKQDKAILVLVISGVINVVLSLLLCGPLGIKGAFLSNTLCMMVILILLKVFAAHGRN